LNYGEDGTGKDSGRRYTLAQGDAIVFEMTVPEGMPVKTISVTSNSGKSALWDVVQLSGRIPLMSTFVVGE
jgi:hypothetical protein